MRYHNIRKGIFLERPNRFIAYVEVSGKRETVHVKNTGRCTELLVPGACVYIQDCRNPARKTRWDLIAVMKGKRIINMDSQAPNQAVREWLESGGLFSNIDCVQAEYTYGNSRIDLYAESGAQRILIEIKGVTLEEDGTAMFPDAPSERAVKHVEELRRAVKEGYEAYIFFVIQMREVRCFIPNRRTHPMFAEALERAAEEGVHILAYDCDVTKDSIQIADRVLVSLENPILDVDKLLKWYDENRRELPWRNTKEAYHIWVSEIMLQQTRASAVIPYYKRFLKELPQVKDLAEAEEDKLLKLWEGLGYYNRVRNMQKAARKIMIDYHGEFPCTCEEIQKLPGIGSYTAGAISSFAYGLPEPAVDGNVLRAAARITADDGDIMKQAVRKRMEEKLRAMIPADRAGDFNQALIELGALVCVPNGAPRCEECPVHAYCEARKQGRIEELPVRSKAKKRKIEKKTILVFRDENQIAVCKRPSKGLLAGLYELPNIPGHLKLQEVTVYCREIGLMPVRIKKLSSAKHIFSHVEWHMTGYEVQVDELEKTNQKGYLFIHPEEIQKLYPIPSAFEMYMPKT